MSEQAKVVVEPIEIPLHSEQELREIAQGIQTGAIWTHLDCPEPTDLVMMFMPFALMEPKLKHKLRTSDIGLIYEHINRAGPRSINGRPCFVSFKLLNEADADKVQGYCRELQKSVEVAGETP
ncbi:hypothetical protein LCGC14_0235620 [marine sediment metagenome]|uniref:Uncharacterized protein n=1 Tax=marine sediment metagenome TaxID=412755 RepID=A0A0F9WTS1_9ZZZZ